MPEQLLPLRKNDPNTLKIQWKGGWRSCTVSLDGETLLDFPNAKALKEGSTVGLPDGGQLSVRLVSGKVGSKLEVLVDGEPVPGSQTDPEVILRTSYGIIFLVGGFSAGLGLLAEMADIQFLRNMGMGSYSIIFGMVFIALGFFVKQRSTTALVIATGLFFLDTIATVIVTSKTAHGIPIGAIIVKIFFLLIIAEGFPAISKLQSTRQHLLE